MTGAAAAVEGAPVRYLFSAARASGDRIFPSACAASRATAGASGGRREGLGKPGDGVGILQLSHREHRRGGDLDVARVPGSDQERTAAPVGDAADGHHRASQDFRM